MPKMAPKKAPLSALQALIEKVRALKTNCEEEVRNVDLDFLEWEEFLYGMEIFRKRCGGSDEL